MNAPLPAAAPAHARQEAAYLAQLGDRVRAWRNAQGVTRKALAMSSGVSERYLAQLEAGQGNISVLLLRKVALAMNVTVESLVREADGTQQGRRIALIGLRGAGKSSLGAKLAASLGLPFVELDAEVAKEAGVPLGDVFSTYGQEGYRRFERRALERVLNAHKRAVIAVGGSVVNDAGTYQLLRDSCRTVWLKAKPEEHMNRVMAQGDLRPFKGRSAAIDEIRRLLADRDRLYALADATLETSGRSLKAALEELKSKVKP